jgi:hypothetical protein
MAVTYSIAVNVCDDCGHRWLPEVKKSPRCPNRKCRSTHWNDSGKTIADDDALVAASRSATSEKLPDFMARLGLTTASKMHEQPSVAILTPAEDDEPTLPPCPHTEWGEDGEQYQCRLTADHKGKCQRGQRIS